MRIRLGHIIFALIIASILNLATAWLCAYYAVPGYQGAILLSADEFDKGADLITERDHDLAIMPWSAFGITELDCTGPWYLIKTQEAIERKYSPQECADQLDMIMEENVLDHVPSKQNFLRRQLLDFIALRHTRIDAGWPMRSFRGFVSTGLQEPIMSQNPNPKRLPQEDVSVISVERSYNKTFFARHLPYMPIWLGLIVNTLLYATVIIAIMWISLTVRAKLRLRRNLCPNCKYPIGVSEVCTECGYELKSCVAKT